MFTEPSTPIMDVEIKILNISQVNIALVHIIFTIRTLLLSLLTTKYIITKSSILYVLPIKRLHPSDHDDSSKLPHRDTLTRFH